MRSIKGGIFMAAILGFLTGCVGTPEGTEPITGFELERYLGKWYEIARFDHRFERGLSDVTAEYSMREKGGILVRNRGFKDGEWEEAIGKAYPAGEEGQGKLKVSFFGPFYAGYNILKLDPDYKHALVTGPNRKYLWILSRTPQMPERDLEQYISFAQEKGFPTEGLIFVEHGKAER